MGSNKIIIAIDGPSSSGKSTLAKDAAQSLGYTYIDTGAMYRAVTLFAIRAGLIKDGKVDENGLVRSLQEIQLEFRPSAEGKSIHLFLNGMDVETEIRGLEVARMVSPVAAIPEVRRDLQARQQKLGEDKGVVMDGRDIGTAVFPQAELKIFLTAPAEERARRRLEEMRAKGIQATLEEVTENVRSRDLQDSSRKDSPLRQAPDAILLDNSNLSRQDQLDRLLSLYHERRD